MYSQQQLDQFLCQHLDIDAEQLQQQLQQVDVEHEDENVRRAVQRLFLRIPVRWGRYIACGNGWYGLLAGLEQRLVEETPNFFVQQIKEKFGTLRVYADSGIAKPASYPTAPEKPQYSEDPEQRQQQFADHDAQTSAWYQQLKDWRETTSEGIAYQQQLDRFFAIIDEFEVQSEHTCELCGAGNAAITKTKSPYPWLKTLCPQCAAKENRLFEDQWQLWWQQERPVYVQENRVSTKQRLNNSRNVQMTSSKINTVFDCDRIENPEQAANAVDAYDNVMLDSSPTSLAFVEALLEKFKGHLQVIENKRKESAGRGFLVPKPEGAPTLYWVGPYPKHFPKVFYDYNFTNMSVTEYMVDDDSWQELQARR